MDVGRHAGQPALPGGQPQDPDPQDALETAEFLGALRKSPTAPGFDKLRIAGEPERETRARRERDGIAVDDNTWEEILAAGGKLKLGRDAIQRIAEGR